MKNKLGAKEICAAVVVAGIALCLVIYILVFNKYKEETDILKSSNAQLQVQVDDLKQYYDNMELYRKSIATMKEVIAQVTADYPGNALEEDTIMMAVNMQNTAPVNIESINISPQNIIHSIPADVVKGLNDETLQSDINFQRRSATYNIETNYFNFKDIVGRIYDDKYRIAINSVSFSKEADENNYISGVIDISYYSLDGMNKEYKKPDMTEYMAGVEDFFHATVEEEEE